MSGKYGNQLPAIAIGSVVPANDLFTVYDASAAGTSGDDYDKTVTAAEMFNRMLNSADISWMPTSFSAISSFGSGDRFLVWDSSTSRFVPVNYDLITNRLLSTADLSWMSTLPFADLVSGDYFLVWDATANAVKVVNIVDLLSRVRPAIITDVTTTPYSVTSGMTGTRLTNRGAAQVIRFDLPALTAGMRFTFSRIANYGVRIYPNGSETIAGGGAGKYLEITTRGPVEIECFTNGEAEVVGGAAVYEVEP
jgi:hypothetical protein